MRKLILLFLTVSLAAAGGCGYTASSLLPPELDSIHVDNFENKIDPAKEVSDKRASYSYWPGLETEITRAVIDGFIFDRHLDIKSEAKAALLLKGALTDYRQFPLSYDINGNVEEFRIEVLVDIELYDQLNKELMWKERSFMGQTSYTIAGPNSETEAENGGL